MNSSDPRRTAVRQSVGVLVALAVLATSAGFGYFASVAHAASLTGLSDTMSNLTASATSSHVIRFTTPSGADQSSDTIIITFPSDFNFSSKTIGTLSLTHGTTTGAEVTETLAASASATAWGAVFSGTQNRILTLTPPTDGIGAGGLFATQKVIITYDSTNSINASSANSYVIDIAGSFGDTGSITVPILTNDQVAVTATVNQSITFTISDNTIGFGTLSASNARYATGDAVGTSTETEAFNFVVGTNAASGYVVTLQGGALADTLGDVIDPIGGTNTASSAGTEQFGVRYSVSGSGSGSVTAPYAASGFAYAASATTTSQVASASAATANNTYSARYLANIASLTPAAAYTATSTYVATANY